MSKNVLLGMAGFGGLVLVGVLLNGQPGEGVSQSVVVEEVKKATLPSGMSSFPIYIDAEIVTVRDTDGEDSRDVSVTLNAKASKNEIHEWYREALSQNGWGIKSDKNVAGYQIIQGENANLYTSLQTANGSEAGYVTITQHLKVRK